MHLIAFFAGPYARAQGSFNGSVTATATVQTVVAMSITNNSSTSITLSSPSQYTGAYLISHFNSFVIKGNIPWAVSVASSTPYFTNSGVYSSLNMPASIIQLNITSSSSILTLSSTAQTLSSGSTGNGSQTGNSFDMDFSVNPGYDYGPGIYSLTMIYTLSAQ